MASYEQEIKERINNNEPLPSKLEYSLVKYFWQANPLLKSNKTSIPRYLRTLPVLRNFSDTELKLLSNSLHFRTFDNGEKIFKQGDVGVGFYFIFSGNVDVIVEQDIDSKKISESMRHVVALDRQDYFGELSLLQENSVRNASAIAQNSCELLGIFKPDLENLINTYPIVATKLLQSVSVIIANRLFSITKEVRNLKFKIKQLEKSNEELIREQK